MEQDSQPTRMGIVVGGTKFSVYQAGDSGEVEQGSQSTRVGVVVGWNKVVNPPGWG